MLHFIGAPLYITGIFLMIAFLFGMNIDPIAGIILWITGVVLFLMGHKIERNIKSNHASCSGQIYSVKTITHKCSAIINSGCARKIIGEYLSNYDIMSHTGRNVPRSKNR
jgi:uncharacterized membrane protein